MRVADLGCGVGGPLREIARVSGATIVGVNNNDYQIERARKLTEEAGLGHLAEFLKSDFMQMDAPDESFDAAYAIEATVHAPSKVDCYGEVFRVLKPGGCFAAYDYCLTSRFDANNRRHRQIKSDLEVGGALPDIALPQQVDDALRQVGFELLDTVDLAEQAGPGIPWYQPLAGSRFSFASFRSSRSGTPSDAWHVTTYGSARNCAQGNRARVRTPELVCNGDGDIRSPGYLHADVLRVRAQAAVAPRSRAGHVVRDRGPRTRLAPSVPARGGDRSVPVEPFESTVQGGGARTYNGAPVSDGEQP